METRTTKIHGVVAYGDTKDPGREDAYRRDCSFLDANETGELLPPSRSDIERASANLWMLGDARWCGGFRRLTLGLRRARASPRMLGAAMTASSPTWWCTARTAATPLHGLDPKLSCYLLHRAIVDAKRLPGPGG